MKIHSRGKLKRGFIFTRFLELGITKSVTVGLGLYFLANFDGIIVSQDFPCFVDDKIRV